MSSLKPNKFSTPTKPKGTRDFGPEQMAKRNYLIGTIRDVFTKYGFLQLETPAMENLSVLSGKYGNEGDQLLFKILNSGDFLSKVKGNVSDLNSKEITNYIAEKGLRYDLTVPFARYVVMNRNEITFPFRRYQIQPVWRADRPQKGRYREFLQCDADIIGTKSLLCEAEIIMMLNEIFAELKLEGYEIVINNRKFLTGLSEFLGQPAKENELCVAIDKLDKIGQEKVFAELMEQGFTKEALSELAEIISIEGTNKDKVRSLKSKLGSIELVKSGLEEIDEVLELVNSMSGNMSTVKFDPSLARGLSYYTGIIFEVRMIDGSIGSISGGGRYDDLTSIFGMPDVSGVGISLGIERIFDVMESRNLFQETLNVNSKVLFINFGDENRSFSLSALASMRKNGISSELYPDTAKMKKQMSYADKNNILLVVIAGAEEVDSDAIIVKNMSTGEQTISPIKELVSTVATLLN